MSEITIDLVDNRHIITRGSAFKHGAENHHFYDEEKARNFLNGFIKYYKKLGYEIKEVEKDAFVITKRG